MGSETIIFRPTKLYWIIFLMAIALISFAAIKGSGGPQEKFIFMTAAAIVISILFSFIALLQMSYSIELSNDRFRYSRFIKIGDELFYSEIKRIDLMTGSKGESILKLGGPYNLECKLAGLSRKQQVELLKQLIQKTPSATANHLAINVSKQQFTELNKDVNKKVLWFAIPVILAVILKIIF
ncbi:hypothetical protein CIB95_09115 [Lottiidibacillus patelloidae]|uniref:PH domain-containing protein n=1 Tax=Lottiidibacillus patelloidae TaxID=2670334 RepID=A0A263BT72_9BACI|nr:hypothetical protein [Lottiidibacillus patelloidae]OZM56920.1 hypothetical protein CIB95_09115 [Lottiidibacillus patelloidae]